MTRSFTGDPVDEDVLADCVDLASRAPSAGKTQGWHLVGLRGPDTSRFWDATLAPSKRASFAWPGLLDAPVLFVVCAEPEAYLARYSEPDKVATGLGASRDAWPAPYWTVDAGFGVMTLLLALESHGLGALFFAVPHGHDTLRRDLGIGESTEIVGAVAIGHPDDTNVRQGRSASRPRMAPESRLRWVGGR
jgi:nitroreductase